MFCARFLWISGLVSVFLAAALAAADEKSAEKALKDKGLRRVSSNFTLPEETEIGKQVRAADGLKRKVIDAMKAAVGAEQTVRQKEKLITTYLQQRSALRVQLQRAKSVQQYNNIITAMEELGDRIIVLEKRDEVEKAARTARAAANAAREQYIEHLLKTRKMYEQLKEKYADLAADPKVGDSIKEYNKAAGKSCKLGPSASFTSNDRRLRKLEETVLSESIAIRRGDGDLWYVSAMFNGKHTEEISVDTGSSVIALPWALAEKMGVTPSSQDPTIQLQMADGRIIEGKQIYLDSVRVGKFAVEDVEAAVFPKDAVKAGAMLGLSFLEHFSYKIDTGNSKLIMTRVEGAEEKRRRRRRPK